MRFKDTENEVVFSLKNMKKNEQMQIFECDQEVHALKATAMKMLIRVCLKTIK